MSAERSPNATETLVLGGGCFWCLESVFKEARCILDIESGYSNGQLDHPSYEDVCRGDSGHAEVVKLVYDPAIVTLADLLDVFFAIHDPTQLNGQGHDLGSQYRSGIYATTEAQLRAARAFVNALPHDPHWSGTRIVTEIEPLTNYWAAEDYHQDFFERNPTQGYCLAVAAPKIAKFRARFGRLARPPSAS